MLQTTTPSPLTTYLSERTVAHIPEISRELDGNQWQHVFYPMYSTRLYLDQNVWNHSVRPFYSALEFNRLLADNDLKLITSFQNVCEFAKGLLKGPNSKSYAECQDALNYLLKVKVHRYCKVPMHLIEYDKGRALNFRYSTMFHTAIESEHLRSEIHNLVCGNGHRITNDIVRRQRNQIATAPAFVAWARSNCRGKHSTFQSLLQDNGMKRMVMDDTLDKVPDAVLFERPEKFPFLNALVNANLYQIFAAAQHDQFKPTNSIDDYFHLICANAADVFITADRRFRNRAAEICPWLKIETAENFFANLQHPPV